MNTARSVFNNAFFITFSNIATKIIALFIVFFLARHLGVTDFGKYNFIIAYITIFGFVAGFGLDPVVIRSISKQPSETTKIMNNALAVRIFTSFAAIILSIAGIKILMYPSDILFYVQLVSIVLLAQGLSYLFESLFQAKMKMQFAAISIISSKIFFAIIVSYLLKNNYGLQEILITYVASELLRTFISYTYSKKMIPYTLKVEKSTYKGLIKESLPFVLGYGLLMLYNRFDIVMLSVMKGDTSVGFYSAAYRLTESMLFIPGALSATLMPVMVKQFKADNAKLNKTYRLGTKYVILIILPITVGSILLGESIIHLIYKQAFTNSIIVFKILSFTIIFNSLVFIQNAVLVATDNQHFNNISIMICSILNIVLNIILIPKYNYTGAGIATLLSVICLYVIGSYFIIHKLKMRCLELNLLKFVIASLVMGLVITQVETNLLGQVTIGVITYVMLILALKGFTKQDLILFKR